MFANLQMFGQSKLDPQPTSAFGFVSSQPEQPTTSSFGFLTNNSSKQIDSAFNFVSMQQDPAPAEKSDKMEKKQGMQVSANKSA